MTDAVPHLFGLMPAECWPVAQLKDPWQELISLCDLRPLEMHAAQLAGWPSGAVTWFENAEILRELPLDEAVYCPGCPDSPCCDVQWSESAGGGPPIPWTWCPECGHYDVPREVLRRWAIRFEGVIQVVATQLDIRGNAEELIPHRLWRLGKVRWNQRPVTVFCGRGANWRDGSTLVREVTRFAGAVLLVPRHVPDETPACPVIPLSLAAGWDGNEIVVDREFVTAQLPRATECRPPSAKRSRRLALQEQLRQELELHLRAVADHFRSAIDFGREPEPLPCPTRKELARRCRASAASVSRCFAENPQLERLWETISDPLAVLAEIER